MNDASIIELFRNRNEQAITELKIKYENLCFHIAGNFLSQREDIEECVNTAFFDIWNSIPPDDPADLRTYLCRIVKNKAIDRLKYNSAQKRNACFSVSLDELDECIPDKSTADDKISTQYLTGLLERFLKSIDDKHRIVFIRRYWYGDSLSVISAACGINEKTVATYLFRTRKKLKKFLQKEGVYYE